MARKPRLVIPDCPHHVTQRGNYRQQVFSTDIEYRLYLCLLEDYSTHYGVSIQAYCLMPNHVHLIATPQNPDGLSRMMRVLNGGYARWLHLRTNRAGHLWQGRYFSQPLDREEHFWNAMLYIEQNPNAPSWSIIRAAGRGQPPRITPPQVGASGSAPDNGGAYSNSDSRKRRSPIEPDSSSSTCCDCW